MKKKVLFVIRLSLVTALIMGTVLTSYKSIYYQLEVAPSPIESEVLSKVGSRGEEVRSIQTKLKEIGLYKGTIDGVFGTETAKAVKKFQQQKGLQADGIAGIQTLTAMGIYGNTETVYKNGAQGDMVRKIQAKLTELGYYTGVIDGIYGNGTTIAVQQFQAAEGLTADGVTGERTLTALGLSENSSVPPQSGNIDNDLYLLARMISAESRGEPYIGQVAVGAVILNRVKHPSFPNSIVGVLYQPGAFSAIQDGQFDQPIKDSAYRAARDALNGMDPTGGAIYYYNPAKTTNAWMFSRPVLTTIGNHVFAS